MVKWNAVVKMKTVAFITLKTSVFLNYTGLFHKHLYSHSVNVFFSKAIGTLCLYIRYMYGNKNAK